MTKGLTELFNTKNRGEYVSSSDINAANLKQLDENMALKDGGAEEIGRISLSHSKTDEHSPDSPKQKEKLFSDFIQRLQKQRLWVLHRMNEIQDDIDRLNHDIDEASRNIRALKDVLDDLEEGMLELDESGYPADERDASLIKDWEVRFDEKWDANDPSAITILGLIMAEQEQEIQHLETVRDEKLRQYNELNSQFHDLEGTIEEVSNNRDNLSQAYLANYFELFEAAEKSNESSQGSTEPKADSPTPQVHPLVIDLDAM